MRTNHADDPGAVYDAMREAANRLLGVLVSRSDLRATGLTDELLRAQDVRRRIRAVDLDDLDAQRKLAAELRAERERLT
ncbi:hypothetical protein H4J02_06535 [Protaetiibacter sp. SSC-01]|uniref:hypothetical protein n=1 Tax=Protaetiibacter sp. SSC-01 TaxID=2759943 RepID=UPI0016572681|nr:hypothetical protein [Protaetiibacter sp. SSC-01]QNO38643.1 hypothetical protein H4J02_06535 [Protaetiibacter sp. SSC-01]